MILVKQTIAYQGKLDAKRKKGRPPTSLLCKITNVSKLRIHEIARASKDRDSWRSFVMTSTVSFSDVQR